MWVSYALASRTDGNTHPPLPTGLDDADLSLIARTDAFVLFTGRVHVRTLAIKIHNSRADSNGAFRAVDCGAAPDVLEPELFRVLEHDPGPTSSRIGEGARRPGTLFLHEVGRLSRSAQARLRDAISRGSATREAARVRWRIIASTSDPLLPRVVDGTFDDRLFYLLNVMHFDVRQS